MHILALVRLNENEPVFFPVAADLRKWFGKNHQRVQELWIGFYRKDSGHASITWPESVDEALCFGWIDGIRKKIDDISYKIRFTPRRPKSVWSAINIARVEVLTRDGRMHAAGAAAFARRDETRSRRYSFENRATAKLSRVAERQFRSHSEAWKFFRAQPPSYQRMAAWWVVSAKRAETQQKRLARLIAASQARRRL